uniref:Protein phosphatase 1 regulatory subunit n=1 Tax=Cynoglossus semilaevis TaxID=244447 RepID=A0A3P8UR24_CYNSE
MNCRVLRILNPRPEAPPPIMPVDMAVRICFANSPPLHSFMANYKSRFSSSSSAAPEPPRPCLSSGTDFTVMEKTAAAEISCSSSVARKKKSVAFADSQGFALAAVYIYDEAEEDLMTELQYQLREIEGATAALHLEERNDLVLDFTPPVADYLDLRNRLKAQHVCLETCFVQEQRLSGTVQVQNLCFKKSVSVRVTFDSWQSFKDVPCQYLNNVYGCDNTNTFSFSLELPELLELGSRVEFCIQYQAEDQTYWDNNHGTNYCLLVLDQVTEKTEKMEFDPYGSPRTSAGFFPEWQSWGRVDAHAPYW